MMMLTTTKADTFKVFSNQPLTRLAGVYFENLGDLFFYRSHWKLINYINLSSLEDKERILTFFLNKINILSTRRPEYSDQDAISTEIRYLRKKIEQLSTYREILNDLIGRPEEETGSNTRGTRFRRGAFNLIQQIPKTLFGTLDFNDADYYNKQIDLLYNNSKQTINLYKEQISIIQSTASHFSKTFVKHGRKFKEVDFNLNQLNKQLMNLSKTLTVTQQNIVINSYLLECSEMALEFKTELETLTDATLLARRGLLHPKILSPKELINNLRNVQYLPHDKKFPVRTQSMLELNQFHNLQSVK